MKSKIHFRLLLYFSGSLLVFSLLIGLLFFSFFSRYNMDLHKTELEDRAVRIADALAGFWLAGGEEQGHLGLQAQRQEQQLGQQQEQERHHQGQQGFQGQDHAKMGQGPGYGAYLRLLDDIAGTDVWIVDCNLKQVVRGHGQTSLSYKDLPPGADEVIATALEGKPILSESFGVLIGTPSITVATPILLPGGEIAGVVLLHEQIKVIRGITERGLVILLLSMGVAMIIAFFVASILSKHFTKPLSNMQAAALKVSGGDYAARTGVAQDDEIGALAGALDEMAVKLEVASRESAKLEKLRRGFVANISHELRTPVTVIRGSLEAICDGVVSEPGLVDEYHRQMLAESIYLERLVTDLLNLALLQNPDFEMEMQKVDLKEIVADALRSVGRLAKSKGVALRSAVGDGDFVVCGDYGRLRQMLVIVWDNAIKFSPEGTTVFLEMKQTAAGIALCIRDEGCGIPSAELSHIFERFHKQRSEENKGGTGLGLAIAKQIADRHRITIEVQSEPGEGTLFSFLFHKVNE